MPNMMENASDWLASQLTEHLGSDVKYRRGTTEVELTATIGRTEFELLDALDADIQSRAFDFIITAADLDLGSGPTEPAQGDLIILCRGQSEITHEVLPITDGDQCFMFSDPYGKMFRIHSQRTDKT